ncbi:MAG: S-adenosylmethionine-dependent methyltransferase SmtA [Idiomarinaceae bacterium HL-53]|nr:MAG: S-adenosylmethionine-dependent methyltransferase SmtA [Idiomarinaceae bacterium HL-53]CUS48908.1 S-adenosylmethionine-dependent methyltransferase [Idiomarinaceae bacterium HL-53]
MTDRVFTDDAARFTRNIYGTLKGEIRTRVLQADLDPLANQQPMQVLDIGAGGGQIGAWLAQFGHTITHVEPSADMLQEAQTRHAELGVMEQFTYVADTLQGFLPSATTYDLVQCHAVLEWLDDPFDALQRLLTAVKPGGWLSLMFYNVEAKRFANLVYGNFDYVRANLQVKKKVRFSPTQPLKIQVVKDWIAQTNLTLCVHSGVRCIHDYLRHPEKLQAAELIQEELAFRQIEPYRTLGRYQHFLLRNTGETM